MKISRLTMTIFPSSVLPRTPFLLLLLHLVTTTHMLPLSHNHQQNRRDQGVVVPEPKSSHAGPTRQSKSLDHMLDPIYQEEQEDNLESKRVVAKSVYNTVIRVTSTPCEPGTQRVKEGGPCVTRYSSSGPVLDEEYQLSILKGITSFGGFGTRRPSSTPSGGGRNRNRHKTTTKPTTTEQTTERHQHNEESSMVKVGNTEVLDIEVDPSHHHPDVYELSPTASPAFSIPSHQMVVSVPTPHESPIPTTTTTTTTSPRTGSSSVASSTVGIGVPSRNGESDPAMDGTTVDFEYESSTEFLQVSSSTVADEKLELTTPKPSAPISSSSSEGESSTENMMIITTPVAAVANEEGFEKRFERQPHLSNDTEVQSPQPPTTVSPPVPSSSSSSGQNVTVNTTIIEEENKDPNPRGVLEEEEGDTPSEPDVNSVEDEEKSNDPTFLSIPIIPKREDEEEVSVNLTTTTTPSGEKAEQEAGTEATTLEETTSIIMGQNETSPDILTVTETEGDGYGIDINTSTSPTPEDKLRINIDVDPTSSITVVTTSPSSEMEEAPAPVTTTVRPSTTSTASATITTPASVLVSEREESSSLSLLPPQATLNINSTQAEDEEKTISSTTTTSSSSILIDLNTRTTNPENVNETDSNSSSSSENIHIASHNLRDDDGLKNAEEEIEAEMSVSILSGGIPSTTEETPVLPSVMATVDHQSSLSSSSSLLLTRPHAIIQDFEVEVEPQQPSSSGQIVEEEHPITSLTQEVLAKLNYFPEHVVDDHGKSGEESHDYIEDDGELLRHVKEDVEEAQAGESSSGESKDNPIDLLHQNKEDELSEVLPSSLPSSSEDNRISTPSMDAVVLSSTPSSIRASDPSRFISTLPLYSSSFMHPIPKLFIGSVDFHKLDEKYRRFGRL